jgi:hypothetical protein
MAGHQREKERLLDLAVDYGFDRVIAADCLARIVNLYGTSAALPPPTFLRAPTAEWLRRVLFSWDPPRDLIGMRSSTVTIVGERRPAQVRTI